MLGVCKGCTSRRCAGCPPGHPGRHGMSASLLALRTHLNLQSPTRAPPPPPGRPPGAPPGAALRRRRRRACGTRWPGSPARQAAPAQPEGEENWFCAVRVCSLAASMPSCLLFRNLLSTGPTQRREAASTPARPPVEVGSEGTRGRAQQRQRRPPPAAAPGPLPPARQRWWAARQAPRPWQPLRE